jgi:hypothetical protein
MISPYLGDPSVTITHTYPDDTVVEHRGQLLEALRAGWQRHHAEIAARSTHSRAQATSGTRADESES